MNNTGKRNTGRILILVIIAIAGLFIRKYVRDYSRQMLTQQLPQQQSEQELDYINQLSEELGETVLVYSLQPYYNFNGSPDFDKVIFLTGEENAFTGVGCAFFDKEEMNKQVGFMNVVSGYDTVLDKIVLAETVYNDDAGFAIYDLGRTGYKNWGFSDSMFAVADSAAGRVEILMKNGDTKLCEESRIENVYEIDAGDSHSFKSIYFYDKENNMLGQYSS